PDLVVEPDAGALAGTIADRVLEEIAAVQSAGAVPSVVLTGGTIADRAHREIAARTGRHDVDWRRVDVWWGDERFVPAGDPERNAGQARGALLDGVGADSARMHEMPASDGGLGLDEAATAYADELDRATPDGTPRFDLLMLGLGPDGHIASLFPGRSELREARRSAVAVVGSPKPPPDRISMTYPTLNRARKVWFLVAGEDKAEAVRRAVAGDSVERTPGAGVRGTEETLWLLDEAAASSLRSHDL
ncbi:MAG: 6-phosphogluconolactonase, partial [Nocardioidaceae bacterium]